MFPGNAFFASRGGFGHGFGGGQGHPPGAVSRLGTAGTNRALSGLPGARREKFYVDEAGTGHIEAGDVLTIEVNEDGGVTIELQPPKTGNGNGEKSRSLFGRRQKMAVATSNNGEVTVRPEGDGVLEIVGDPLSGAITIIELHPEPIGAGNGD